MATPIPTNPIWKMSAQDLRHDLDLSRDELLHLFDLSIKLKRQPERFRNTLGGQYLGLLFEKPSLRTRLTFELAIKQLGGDAVATSGMIGDREPIKDVARNLDRWTHCIVARVFTQETIEELARWAAVPVINALSDLYHPCQALADYVTLKERFERLEGLKLAFVGDGNNVAHSLMLNAPRLGVNFAIATPKGFEPNPDVVEKARAYAAASGATLLVTADAAEAVSDAHAVYTDVWTSMGQEKEAEARRRIFSPFQVTESLMAGARGDAIFLHCLPAKRGQEVTDGVIESPQSAVFDQAENRLHAQKALLLMLLG